MLASVLILIFGQLSTQCVLTEGVGAPLARTVFLNPFGASVELEVIEAIAGTRAVDLWNLFPYGAINKMLVGEAMPPQAWADRLTRIFGTDEWKKDFYSTSSLAVAF